MKKLLVITLCIITLVFSACSGNNEKFEAKLSEQKEVSKVKLTELTDFKWDYAYFISPYVSKEEIEKIISIKSDEIQDNNNMIVRYMWCLQKKIKLYISYLVMLKIWDFHLIWESIKSLNG